MRPPNCNRHGCLYFSKDAPPGSHPAVVSGDNILREKRENVADRFAIGPMVHTNFWNKERADMDIDRGPCTHCTSTHFLSTYADYQIATSALDYIRAPALREIAWIEKNVKTVEHDDLSIPSRNLYPPEEHVSVISTIYLLRLIYNQRRRICRRRFYGMQTSVHLTYLWTPREYCQSYRLAELITGPLFSGGRPPKFLEYKGEAILELPENFKDFGKDAQASIGEQMANSMMLCLYEKHTAQRNPILYKMFKYPEGLTSTSCQ